MKENNIKFSDKDTAVHEDRILFEDNHILVVNKNPSEIVQGDKTGDTPLSELLKVYLKGKYNKPGNVFMGVVHRLDRPVSGAVVFARTSKALTRLNAMMKNRDMHKIYWAVVKTALPKEADHLIHYLKKNEKQNKSYAKDEPTEGYKKAEMKYKVLAKSDTYYLVEVELLTGRHHQIRAQFSSMGCPIKGDLKYGAKRSNPNGSIHLHARSVNFIHPVSKKAISCTANPPDDPVWNAMIQLLDSPKE